MKFLAPFLAALALIGAGLLSPALPTEAAACKTITDGDARVFIYPTYYSFGLTWQHAGFGSQQYLVERSDDNGASWYTVQLSTVKSYTATGSFLPDDTKFRLSTANCDTPGVVFEHDPPGTLPVFQYYNQDIY